MLGLFNSLGHQFSILDTPEDLQYWNFSSDSKLPKRILDMYNAGACKWFLDNLYITSKQHISASKTPEGLNIDLHKIQILYIISK